MHEIKTKLNALRFSNFENNFFKYFSLNKAKIAYNLI